jgi:xanthine dehydrogenase iron-sulfur cluster and FAD-binding subunit A
VLNLKCVPLCVELQVRELLLEFPISTVLYLPHRSWLARPVSLAGLLVLKHSHPEAPVIVGNTEIGVEVKFKHIRPPVFIAATHVAELQRFEMRDDGLEIGAGLTLAVLGKKLEALCESQPINKVLHAAVTARTVVEV